MLKPSSCTRELGQKKKFEDTPDYNRYRKEKKWFEMVKSPRTGDYYQADYLIQKDLVNTKPDPKLKKPAWTSPHVDAEGKPLTYPLKYVNGIYRVRIADGSE